MVASCLHDDCNLLSVFSPLLLTDLQLTYVTLESCITFVPLAHKHTQISHIHFPLLPQSMNPGELACLCVFVCTWEYVNTVNLTPKLGLSLVDILRLCVD